MVTAYVYMGINTRQYDTIPNRLGEGLRIQHGVALHAQHDAIRIQHRFNTRIHAHDAVPTSTVITIANSGKLTVWLDYMNNEKRKCKLGILPENILFRNRRISVCITVYEHAHDALTLKIQNVQT
jgi:hypothetical protein